jgi:hypothetical protein
VAKGATVGAGKFDVTLPARSGEVFVVAGG